MTLLHALFIEDNDDDFRLVTDELRRFGFELNLQRVQTEPDMARALAGETFDIVIADYRLPQFNGVAALVKLRSAGFDTPFILVSSTIGEELAVELMRCGAQDYVMKERLGRLGPVVERELRVAANRREQKESEDALRQLQGRFQATFEQAAVGIVHGTPSGHVSLVNERFCRMLGYSREELLGINLFDLTHPDDRSLNADVFRRLLSGEIDVLRVEKRYVRKDGSPIWVSLTVSPARAENGVIEYFIGVAEDITERRAAQEQVRFHASLLDAVQQSVVSVNRAGKIVYWNRFAEKLYGWPAEEAIGRDIGAVRGPGMSGEQVTDILRRIGDGESFSAEFTLPRRDGTLIPVMMMISPLFDSSGNVIGDVGVSFDISDRKNAELERARLTRDLELLLESTDQGIMRVDCEGVCTLVNQAAAAMVGFSGDELLGRNLHQLLHSRRGDRSDYPVEECPTYRVLKSGSTERVRDELLWRKDGSSFHAEYASSPIIEEGVVKGVVVTFADITERSLLETQLERANRVNSLGRIAGTMAHEFNNVLMGIQPFAEIIGRRAADDEKTGQAIDRILMSVKRGKGVTGEILRFTRRAEPALKPEAVPPLVDALASEARALLSPSIEFETHVERGLAILGDANQLHQIFMNLTVNARDAMKRAGTITLAVRPAGANSVFAFGVVPEPEKFIHFLFSDDGVGMTPETLRHMFEPLFTTKKSGTGLGLALAHQVVKQHGGSMFVESELGKGTTFHIFLPRASSQPEPVEMKTAQHKSLVRRVVVVEDDESVASGLIALLEAEGIAVHLVTTGGAAEDAIECAQPDVVVLDVGLPDMEGTEVYRKIRNRWPALPVLFSTGHADASRLDGFLSTDAVSFLSKPYDMPALLGSLQRLAART